MKQREIFGEIEEYHFYSENEDIEKEIIRNDIRIMNYVHWKKAIGYSEWKENQLIGKEFYKLVEYRREDMFLYLLDLNISTTFLGILIRVNFEHP